MRVAVSGANGFVGRHVVAVLEQQPVEPVLILRPGSTPINQTGQHKIVYLDLGAPPDDPFTALGRPDLLIHLAWDGLPNYRSLHHFADELPRQYHFLQAMITGGLQNLLVAGTCFEYGMQSGPLAESAATIPDNPYGFAKDSLRRQLQFLQASHPFNLIWARLFYLYGEGQGEKSLLSQLKTAVQNGEKRFNMSGGEQLRDYLPVAEAATSLVSLALGLQNIGIINVCSGKPTSVRSLVEGWLRENSWSIDLNLAYYPYPDYEPMAFWGRRDKLAAIEYGL